MIKNKTKILALFLLSHLMSFAQTTTLTVNDTRTTNELPNFYSKVFRADFKSRSIIGVPGDGYYSTNLTINPWVNTDNSGNKIHQLNFNDGGLFYRSANPLDTQWGTWRQFVLTDNNGNISSNLGAGTRLFLFDNNNTRNNRIELFADDFGANINSTYSTGGSGAINFNTNGNKRMTINQNGDVGIGTISPQGKLDINADGRLPIIRGNGGYIPAGLTFLDDSYNQPGQVKEWSIFKGNTWAKGLGFFRYDVNKCNGGICDVPLFLSDNGNIAVGGSTSPSEKLYLTSGNFKVENGDIKLINDNNRLVGYNDRVNYFIGAYPVTGSSGLNIHWYGGIKFGTSSGDAMQILQNGNVGIGTTTPQAKLDVFTPVPTPGTYVSQSWSTNNSAFNLKIQTVWNDNGINQNIIQRFNGVDYNSLSFYWGNIGIGTTSPQYKLDVNGKSSFSDNMKINARLEAKEIKVTNSPTADFVFEEDYNLPKLEEVEKHIKEKKHLPEIASAKEMEKDGVNVGEFQIKLLQKIEELTLYTIEQNKEIQELKAQVKALLEKK